MTKPARPITRARRPAHARSLEKLPNQLPWWDKFADAGPGGDAALWAAFLAAQQNHSDSGGGGGKGHAGAGAAAAGPRQQQAQQQVQGQGG